MDSQLITDLVLLAAVWAGGVLIVTRPTKQEREQKTMSELHEALEQEQQAATNYLYSARVKGDELDAAYWLGYLEGSTNAAALIYGPTPLDESERN